MENIDNYKLDATKFRQLTEVTNDTFAGAVRSCVDRFLGISEVPMTPQMVQFLIDLKVLVINTDPGDKSSMNLKVA